MHGSAVGRIGAGHIDALTADPGDRPGIGGHRVRYAQHAESGDHDPGNGDGEDAPPVTYR
ncbi:hypothetical protein GCM10010435_84490 [Winogradskya consettensis]|uniref:Uncharacterized protein n=1 Tax=Winogradskya consettensis TaxID=113560 RepID=A0A919SZC7_9ACTN|nr:hypothetical protein Aco04nite_79610 [Actinoplanes consettensis]